MILDVIEWTTPQLKIEGLLEIEVQFTRFS
jgi:hypothetical protein